MNQELFLKSKSWPFEEAKKIYNKIQKTTPKKGYVLFETGYGPSGLPHIGTFGEVVRTSYVMNAFNKIAPNIKTKMICVSDDIDALRKVPDNIPNQELIKANLGRPLTSVPDPFNTHQSFGQHMNSRLISFLDSFGFEYEFISATDKYKSGSYNDTMLQVMAKYQELMDLMLPTLGLERQKTYSPFMPIDKESGIVIDKGVKSINKEKASVTYYDLNNQEKEISILDGNCKLQWKIDFGARWYSFDVNYEIYGKDHAPNEPIYRKICQILGGKPPINFTYEMFLSNEGEKISKSKGNGIAIEDWLKYAPQESMSLFMYQKPKTAKRLYFDVIPKAMDEYIAYSNSYNQLDEVKKLENPLFHIHSGNVNNINFNINYSLILNLASVCNPENDDILWGFISKYQKNLHKESSPLLTKMINNAINYYNDFIKSNKKYRTPNNKEKLALQDLANEIKKADNNIINDASQIQTMIFSIGKKHGYEKNMREWFLTLYQILLGQDQGPRMGSFIALYGQDNFLQLIDQKL
jgi:lysyl-tRNA synthetase, class I|tara:strand:- start:33426 stop:34994 length:1569 start_codon:yes stop_codon:yes gene_type:complete